jgi:hypothetical protein
MTYVKSACTNCPMFAEYKLTGGYFCMNGAAE